jgi:hypothetical protein
VRHHGLRVRDRNGLQRGDICKEVGKVVKGLLHVSRLIVLSIFDLGDILITIRSECSTEDLPLDLVLLFRVVHLAQEVAPIVRAKTTDSSIERHAGCLHVCSGAYKSVLQVTDGKLERSTLSDAVDEAHIEESSSSIAKPSSNDKELMPSGSLDVEKMTDVFIGIPKLVLRFDDLHTNRDYSAFQNGAAKHVPERVDRILGIKLRCSPLYPLIFVDPAVHKLQYVVLAQHVIQSGVELLPAILCRFLTSPLTTMPRRSSLVVLGVGREETALHGIVIRVQEGLAQDFEGVEQGRVGREHKVQH